MKNTRQPILLFCFFCLPFSFSWGNSVKTDASIEQTLLELRERIDQGFFQEVIDTVNYLLPKTTIARQHADLLTIKANALRQLGQLNLAVTTHQKALSERLQINPLSNTDLASSYINLANCYLLMAKEEEAERHLRNAELWHQKGPADTAKILIPLHNSWGLFYQEQELLQQAQHHYKKSLDLTELIYGKNSPKTVGRLINLAHLNSKQYQLNDAIQLLERAMVIQLDTFGEHAKDMPTILADLGNNWALKGYYAKALNYYKKTLQLAEHQQALEPQVNQYLNLGNCLLEWGEWDNAIAYYRQGLFLSEDRPDLKVDLLQAMAQAYRYEGKVNESMKFLNEAVLLSRNHDLPSKKQGELFFQYGNCYLDIGQWEGAKYYFDRALNLFAQQSNLVYNRVACMNKLATCHLKQGPSNFDTALEWLEKARSLAPETAHQIRFAIDFQLGDLAFNKGQYSLARQFYRQAGCTIRRNHPNWNATAFPYEGAQVNLAIAESLFAQSITATGITKQQSLLQALKQSTIGLDLLDEWRNQFVSNRSIMQVNNSFYGLYHVAIKCAYELHLNDNQYKEKVFQLCERYKNTFLNELTHRYDQIINNPELDSLKSALTQLKRQRFYQHQSAIDINESFIVHQLDSAILHIQQAIQQSVDHHTKQANPAPIPWSVLQNKLGDDESLLNFYWGQKELFLMLLQRDTYLIKTIPIDAQLKPDIDKFNEICRTPPDWLHKQIQQEYIEEYARLGNGLYQKLILPISPYLTKNLSIVPDGVLCELPFEALLSSPPSKPERFHAHQFLIKDYAIQYYQSATWRALHFDLQNHQVKNLVAIAPSFDSSAVGLSKLKYNTEEARLVKNMWNGDLLLGQHAKKEQFLATADQYRMILLSTHGIMNNQNPSYSFLAFNETRDSTLDNDLLFVDEIYNMRLNAALVVLSACQTASGQLSRGEGLLSIARSFFHAGARSIVASLWNAGDQQAKILMVEFFRNLKQEKNKTDALRLAKIAYLNEIEESFDAHPFYWAGFVGIGENDPIKPPKDFSIFYGWLILLTIAGIWSLRMGKY